MGPRVTPSQLGQPIEQPLLNHQHAWPLAPESLPLASVVGHQHGPSYLPEQNWPLKAVKLFHGSMLWSMALREGGYTMAPWPAHAGSSATIATSSTSAAVAMMPMIHQNFNTKGPTTSRPSCYSSCP